MRESRPKAVALTMALLSVGALQLLAAPPSEAQAAGFPQCDIPLDVMFAFDTTGSMGPTIDAAKAGGLALMGAIRAAVADSRFGASNYRDYNGFYSFPGYSNTFGTFGDYPYQLNQPLTTDTSAVQAAINSLTIGNGADFPESLSRTAYESRFLAWRPAALKVLVIFTDAQAHDQDFAGMNYGQDPGRDAIGSTADDLDFETVANQLAQDGVRVVGVGVGVNVGEPYLRHLADTTGGAFALLTGDFVTTVRDLILGLLPKPLTGGTSIGVHAELSNPANPFVDVGPVTSGPATMSNFSRIVHRDLPTQLDGFVDVVNSGSRTTLQPGLAFAHSNETVAEVSLLSGLVYARDLHAVAESTTTPFATASSTAGSEFGRLRVNGMDIPLPVPPNTLIPIPGVGILVLYEVTTATTANKASEVLVNMIHLVVDTAQVRGDITVGKAYAGTTCGPALGAVQRTSDNDNGSGKDAPDTAATAMKLTPPAVFQGRLVDRDDVADYYSVAAAPGMKVEALMLPSTRAEVAVYPPTATPGVVAGTPNFDLYLREPGTFNTRVNSTLPLSAPDRVELNVDKAGDWVIQVQRAEAQPGNYTFAVVVTPIALLPDDQAVGPDAGDTCATATNPASEFVAGTLQGNDFRDFWTLQGQLGEVMSVVMKPTEDLDGADFDLYLHGPTCAEVASSTLGKGLIPKGTPEAITNIPVLVTGTYKVEVRRMNGIGNYYLDLRSARPFPTLPNNDATLGTDAGNSCATATALPAPAGAFEGAMLDADPADFYKVNVNVGQRVVVTLVPSPGNDIRLSFLGPGCSPAAVVNTTPALQYVTFGPATAGGSYAIGVTRNIGGGNYLFTVAVV